MSQVLRRGIGWTTGIRRGWRPFPDLKTRPANAPTVACVAGHQPSSGHGHMRRRRRPFICLRSPSGCCSHNRQPVCRSPWRVCRCATQSPSRSGATRVVCGGDPARIARERRPLKGGVVPAQLFPVRSGKTVTPLHRHRGGQAAPMTARSRGSHRLLVGAPPTATWPWL
jgi:hypothetical protein